MRKTTRIATAGALALLGFVALCARTVGTGPAGVDPVTTDPHVPAIPDGSAASTIAPPVAPETAASTATATVAPRPSVYVEIELRGDARSEDVQALAALGARRVRATTRGRAIYEVAEGALERVQASPAVASVRSPSVEEKLAYELREDLVLRDDDGLIRAEVYYLDGVSGEAAEAIVAAAGLAILRHWPLERSLLVRGDLAALRDAAGDDRVFQVWPDAGAPAAHNLDNAEISNVDRLWSS